MRFAHNRLIDDAVEPPIAEAQGWIAGRVFPQDKPLLDLAQAVPSYPPADELSAHVAERTGHFESAQYTAIRGMPTLRAALADHMAAFFNGKISDDNLLISAGCNQAFCLAIMALASAGDEVILPAPYYFNHQMWLDMLGIKARHLLCRPENSGLPDPAEAMGMIGDKTRALVLVTPNNPTGAIYPPALLREFYELCKERNIALVLDETYKDFMPDGAERHTLFTDDDWGETLVQLYSFSKAYSLTGYRVGSVTAGADFIERVAKIMDTMSICAPRIGQDAALYGLENLDDWVQGKRQMMNGRRAALMDVFRANDLGYELVSAGAYFAYLKHPFNGELAKTVAKRLADEQNILCLPGSYFGPDQEQCLRMAFANAGEEDMPELAQRLKASLA